MKGMFGSNFFFIIDLLTCIFASSRLSSSTEFFLQSFFVFISKMVKRFFFLPSFLLCYGMANCNCCACSK